MDKKLEKVGLFIQQMRKVVMSREVNFIEQYVMAQSHLRLFRELASDNVPSDSKGLSKLLYSQKIALFYSHVLMCTCISQYMKILTLRVLRTSQLLRWDFGSESHCFQSSSKRS